MQAHEFYLILPLAAGFSFLDDFGDEGDGKYIFMSICMYIVGLVVFIP